MTYTLHWEPSRASFKTVRGSVPGNVVSPVSEHVFTSGIPTPANETTHITLYTYRSSKDSPQQPVEVVIEKFEFLP